MKCQNCGSTNLDTHIYCDRCGAVIVRPYRIDGAAIREPKLAVMKAIMKRNESDYIMPIAFVFLPLVAGLASIALGIILSILRAPNPYVAPSDYYWLTYPEFSIAFFGSILSNLFFAYLFYKLVKRANDHYLRERELRAAIKSLIRAAASTPERRQISEGDLMTLDVIDGTAERLRKPWFWAFVAAMPMFILPILLVSLLFIDPHNDPLLILAVLLIISISIGLASLILQIVMMNFLGSTMLDHDRRWSAFSTIARTAMSKMGFPAGRPFITARLPQRDFGLFLVLAFLTGGIFFYYWLYTLAKDPNDHFRNQWAFEDNVLSSVDAVR